MKRNRKAPAPLRLNRQPREMYLQVFLLGFAAIFFVMVPVMILTGGYFVYYGDFNSQQLPFYHLANEAVRSGSFGWNWYTDLGANFIGSYSFYLLGSPFFWLSVLFPQSWVLYLMPWLLALKHGVAALTAYAYIRRFVRSRTCSVIGALLYSYSGFQLFNIFFNHFQDVTAFFPLLLLAMEQRVNENRRGVFALTVGFMAVLNYYFFTGQAVFLILYFIVRCAAPDFNANLRKFFSIALESVIGVAIAAFMLLPSALTILDNNRVGTFLTGMDMVAYNDRTRYLRILQSFFMLPDAPARPNLFHSDYGKWASIGGYLPLFSMAGVISFMSQKKKHWATRLTIICAVCAFIPTLNSMFHMFNDSYYARWYYMPVLILALMTAYALDNPKIKWRGGMVVCVLFYVFCGIVSLLPDRDKDKNLTWLKFAQYPWYFWLVLGACGVMLYLAGMVLVSRKRGWHFQRFALWMTALACVASTAMMVYFGIGLGMYPNYYVSYAIKGGAEIHLEAPENQFFRVDTSEDYDNYPMHWGYSNMRCFHSVVPTSIMNFYHNLGISRDVASRAETKHYPLRALFNVKYYFDKSFTDKGDENNHDIEMPGFVYLKKENGFEIYENEAYIPMGVAYDAYIERGEFDKMTALAREKAMLQALVLEPEQVEQYKDLLHPLADEARYTLTDDNYVEYCQNIAATRTCTTFTYDSYGFTAETAELDKPQAVFFSVPYESGWSAEVDGKAVEIIRADYDGFMAVPCEAGSHTITFHYETPGLKLGLMISAGGLGALVLYVLIMLIAEHKKRPAVPRRKYCYDYETADDLPIHGMYARYSIQKSKSRLILSEDDDEEPPAPEPLPEPDEEPQTVPEETEEEPEPDEPPAEPDTAEDEAESAEPEPAEHPAEEEQNNG